MPDPTPASDALTALLYRSRTDTSRADFLASGAIRAFADHNRTVGISGYLHLEDGQFFQHLEGPGRVVRDLWARIQVDPRHHDVTLIDLLPTPHRRFARWSMGFDAIEPGQSLFDWAARSGISLRGPKYAQVVTAFMEYASGSGRTREG